MNAERPDRPRAENTEFFLTLKNHRSSIVRSQEGAMKLIIVVSWKLIIYSQLPDWFIFK